MHCLASCDFGIAQPTGAVDPYSLGASLHGAENRLFHRSPVGYTALNLFGNSSCHERGIKFRLADLLDVQADLSANQFFQVNAQLINALPTPPDDDAGTGSVNGNRHFLGLPVNLHKGDCGVSILGLNRPP